jgi:hypothetical protein
MLHGPHQQVLPANTPRKLVQPIQCVFLGQQCAALPCALDIIQSPSNIHQRPSLSPATACCLLHPGKGRQEPKAQHTMLLCVQVAPQQRCTSAVPLQSNAMQHRRNTDTRTASVQVSTPLPEPAQCCLKHKGQVTFSSPTLHICRHKACTASKSTQSL